jgi:hypothetical protein
MLSNRFPRPSGDIGNAASFAPGVIFERVASATVDSVVVDEPLDEAVMDGLARAAKGMEARGVGLITTGCGFLAPAQEALQGRIATPLASSSLMLLAPLRARYGEHATIGILTFDANALSERHYGQWDAGPVLVEGLDRQGELYRTIAEDRTELDVARAEADAVDAARRLKNRAGELVAVVLECTNLPPYRSAIARHLDRPVYDVHSLIHWFSGNRPADERDFHAID